MKIAFTSCTSANLVPDQPIWDDIRASGPKHVVLLGDNIYNDVPDFGISHLKEMSDWEFAEHLFARYQQQFREPGFRQLVATPGITLHAIWDDHDFLWNDADGGLLLADPKQADKVKLSTSYMRAFRQALAAKDLSTFPDDPGAAELWADYLAPAFKPLGATSVALEEDGRCWLHLTDGRTLRRKPDILGTAQRAQLQGVFDAYPDALHIIASGVTFSEGDCWLDYPNDSQWLAQAVGHHGWLMLSGDIHRNDFQIHPLSGGGRLVEATASGAASHAYLNGLIKGPEVRNHGLLDIESGSVDITLLSFNEKDKRIKDQPHQFIRTAGGDLA